MKDLINKINSTYYERTSSPVRQKEVWHDLSKQFSPDINLYRHVRPSTIIARETGDLALASLWIVQTALTRPMIHELSLKSEEDNGFTEYIRQVDGKTVCALAHSESSSDPVIINFEGNHALLSGKKNFITAGSGSDIILVTCRNGGAEKINRIALLERSQIPDKAFTDLSIDIFPTVSHSSLELKNFKIEQSRIASISSSGLRRCVKKWGIIERALITEAYISYLLYCIRFIKDPQERSEADEQLRSLQEEQSSLVNKQIEEAVKTERVDTSNIDKTGISLIVEKLSVIKDNDSLSEEDRIKIKDVSLFNMLKN